MILEIIAVVGLIIAGLCAVKVIINIFYSGRKYNPPWRKSN